MIDKLTKKFEDRFNFINFELNQVVCHRNYGKINQTDRLVKPTDPLPLGYMLNKLNKLKRLRGRGKRKMNEVEI